MAARDDYGIVSPSPSPRWMRGIEMSVYDGKRGRWRSFFFFFFLMFSNECFFGDEEESNL